MAKRISLLLALLGLFFIESLAGGDNGIQWGLTDFVRGARQNSDRDPMDTCSGLVGDCVEEEEMMMESETSRRSLAQAQQRFISYGALTKDRVPCNHRGQSYYNCRRSGRANPYRRGCSIITKCARILN